MSEHSITPDQASVRPNHNESGASAVEYGLLIAGIAALIALVVYALGVEVGSLFQSTCDSLEAQRGNPNC